MSYLLDKKAKRRKYFWIAFAIITLLLIFYFRSGFFNRLAYVSNLIFRPVLVVGQSVGGGFGKIGAYFSSKSSLSAENENLRQKLSEDQATMSNYNTVLADNESLKEILGRRNEKNKLVLSVILEKPNQSPYDTLLIDAGSNQGIVVGDTVLGLGNIPLGRISNVYMNSTKVVLFSTAGEKTQVVVGAKNIYMEVVGRGGGNFEMTLPRDFTVSKGDTVALPGLESHVLGIVQTVISDPRDSFIKALLISPVNIQELKFVEIEE